MKTKFIFIYCCFILYLFLSPKLNAQDEDPPVMQGDFSFVNNSTNATITITMECISIPFEGTTTIMDIGETYYRKDTLQNGAYYRRFDVHGASYDRYIYYHKFTLGPNTQPINLGIAGGNQTELVIGWAKYKITIADGTNTYIYYFNNLDSKYFSPLNGNNYGNDFKTHYNGINQNIMFSGNGASW